MMYQLTITSEVPNDGELTPVMGSLAFQSSYPAKAQAIASMLIPEYIIADARDTGDLKWAARSAPGGWKLVEADGGWEGDIVLTIIDPTVDDLNVVIGYPPDCEFPSDFLERFPTDGDAPSWDTFTNWNASLPQRWIIRRDMFDDLVAALPYAADDALRDEHGNIIVTAADCQ